MLLFGRRRSRQRPPRDGAPAQTGFLGDALPSGSRRVDDSLDVVRLRELAVSKQNPSVDDDSVGVRTARATDEVVEWIVHHLHMRVIEIKNRDVRALAGF